MADMPSFVKTPRFQGVSVTTANGARDGSGTPATLITAASTGTYVYAVKVASTADFADGCVTFFVHDGTSHWFIGEIDHGNPAAASATAAAFADVFPIGMVIPSGCSIRVGLTVAPTSGAAHFSTINAGDL